MLQENASSRSAYTCAHGRGSEIDERDAALATGVRELMLKPSTIEELADAIDRQVA
jgi:hypothetical protein